MKFSQNNSQFHLETLESNLITESYRVPLYKTRYRGITIAFESEEDLQTFKEIVQFDSLNTQEDKELREQNEFLQGVISNQSQQLDEANDKIAILIESIGRITRRL